MSKAQVAALTVDRITRMNNRELVDAILSAELPKLSGSNRNEIQAYDMNLLKSLAMRARSVCRQQGY
ncbi:MAG: hypothetical protein ACKVT0_04260 [Planctomycetaceae bacterium]